MKVLDTCNRRELFMASAREQQSSRCPRRVNQSSVPNPIIAHHFLPRPLSSLTQSPIYLQPYTHWGTRIHNFILCLQEFLKNDKIKWASVLLTHQTMVHSVSEKILVTRFRKKFDYKSPSLLWYHIIPLSLLQISLANYLTATFSGAKNELRSRIDVKRRLRNQLFPKFEIFEKLRNSSCREMGDLVLGKRGWSEDMIWKRVEYITRAGPPTQGKFDQGDWIFWAFRRSHAMDGHLSRLAFRDVSLSLLSLRKPTGNMSHMWAALANIREESASLRTIIPWLWNWHATHTRQQCHAFLEAADCFVTIKKSHDILPNGT